MNVLLELLVGLPARAKRHRDGGGRRKSRSGGGAKLERCLLVGASLRKALAALGASEVHIRKQFRERDWVAMIIVWNCA